MRQFMAWLLWAVFVWPFIGPKVGAIFLPILGELRGRIGADVFSHNKGGDYVRLGTTPTNPQTSRQQTTRTLLGFYASEWTNTLTQVQRDSWDVYAAAHPVKNSLGQDVLISGLAWYVKCNTVLADAGAAHLASAPVSAAPSGLATLSVDISALTTGDVTFTATPLGAAEYMQLWVSLPVSQGSTPNKAQCRLVGYSAAAQASPWAATLPHGMPSGMRGVFYAGLMSNEGLLSAYLQAIDDTDW